MNKNQKVKAIILLMILSISVIIVTAVNTLGKENKASEQQPSSILEVLDTPDILNIKLVNDMLRHKNPLCDLFLYNKGLIRYEQFVNRISEIK